MAAFQVARNYFAVYRSQPIALAEGTVVDIDDVTADWVNRDSPGCLVPTGTPAPAEETQADEAPVDEAPVDEAPVDEAPADEAPADEAPADEGAVPKRGRRASA